jgi:hypothetical protein
MADASQECQTQPVSPEDFMPQPKPSPTPADPAFAAFEAAYYDYLRRLGEVWDETVRKIQAAQKECHERGAAGAGQPGEPEKPGETALEYYVEAVRAAWTESQDRYSDAYNKYLGAYRDAWASTNVGDVSPQTIGLILQSACTATWYYHATVGNWSLIAWSGVQPWVLTTEKKAG